MEENENHSDTNTTTMYRREWKIIMDKFNESH